VESINHNYSNYITGKKEVDINQVWAQAWHLYKSGENGMLTQEENKIRDINNKEYEAESSERDLILMYFRSVTPFDEGCEFMTATEIMIELVTKTDNKIKINSTQLGRTLKQLEFLKDKKKVDGAVVKGYYVARIGSSLGQATIKYDKDPHQIKPL
jgi:predicted P-loop ATPase